MTRVSLNRNYKRSSKVTPGGRKVIFIRAKKPNMATCGNCGAKLSRERAGKNRLQKMSKSSRRPERRYPELCSKCSKERVKEMLE